MALGLGALLFVVATALTMGIGLQNQGFEEGLDHWTAKTLDSNRNVVYGPGGGKGSEVPGCDAPDAYGICVVEGPDAFEVTDSGGSRMVTVAPLEGNKMLRLAGPFHDATENQAEEHIFEVSQEFVVSESEPVVTLNYDMFTFDYSGFDELRLRVRVFDEDGTLVNNSVQGGFGSGIDLKTTGWRGVKMDLSPYVGEQMLMQLEVQGTYDSLFGTWGYFDAGTAPVSPVDVDGASAKAPAGVAVDKQVSESGLLAFTMSNTEILNALGEDECIPFTVTLPINEGKATLSNLELSLGSQTVEMVPVGGGLWQAELCIEPFGGGALQLSYDATEGEDTQHFIVMVGQIVLIDPQGVVYDKEAFEAAKSLGKSDEEARAAAAIEGASVTLQRESPESSGSFLTVLSADPGIEPNVNPEITGSDGRFQWDVSEGNYRVVVNKSEYNSVTSKVVHIPPPVLDLHIAMTKVGSDGGGGGGGGGGATTSATSGPAPQDSATVAAPKGCAANANAAFKRKLRKAARMAKRAKGPGAAGRRRAAAQLKRGAIRAHKKALKRCRSQRQ